MPQILKVDSSDPSSWENVIVKTQKVLKGGGVIAFPTDTFYGLGADPCNKDAVERIYEIKGRDSKKPLLLLIHSIKTLDHLVEEPSESCVKLMESYWPGPLTLLFKPKFSIHKNITADLIGLRQPGNVLTRKILSALNHPLTAPSANLSGSAPSTTAQQVEDCLGNKLDLILDGGTCPGGKPSTLVDSTKTPVRLIRAGAISFEKIQKTLNGTLQSQESI